MTLRSDDHRAGASALEATQETSGKVHGIDGMPCLIAGSANPELAKAVAQEAGITMLESRLEHFPDGEMHVRLSSSVRGRDAYVLQPTCTPVSENLIELLLLIDTLRRASAGRVTAIVPYYGYARQDRKFTGREPITAKLIANLVTAAGANRIVSIDLHSPAIQGFFDIGMDHLTAIPFLAEHVADHIPTESVIISPDTGGVKRADLYAKLLGLPMAILYKRRTSAQEVAMAAVIGDVKDKCPIIVDDMITTGGTINQAVNTLLEAGARPEIRIIATHGVLVGDAPRLLANPAIVEVVVTDTVPISPDVRKAVPTLQVCSVANLLANAISRLHAGLSLSALFPPEGTPPV